MKRHILVAIDGSDNSLEALKEAVSLTEVFHCNLFLVNVQPSFHTIHTRLFIGDGLINEYQKELFEKATESAVNYLESQNIDYELIMQIGDPIYHICKLAKDLNAKYIVMGSRGMGIIRGTVLGSVSTGVLHDSKIPLLIIPQKQKK